MFNKIFNKDKHQSDDTGRSNAHSEAETERQGDNTASDAFVSEKESVHDAPTVRTSDMDEAIKTGNYDSSQLAELIESQEGNAEQVDLSAAPAPDDDSDDDEAK